MRQTPQNEYGEETQAPEKIQKGMSNQGQKI